MIKSMCLWKLWKTPAKEEGSVNHHLNTRGFDESNLCPPCPTPPHPHRPLSLRWKRSFSFCVLHVCKHVTSARRHCAQFSERPDSVCLQSVHASVRVFVTCPYKDMNFSWVDFHLLGFCTMLCADSHQPFTGFIHFFAHSENSLLSSSVTEVSSSSSSSSALQYWVGLGLLVTSVQGHSFWLSCVSVRLDSVWFCSHIRSLGKRDYTNNTTAGNPGNVHGDLFRGKHSPRIWIHCGLFPSYRTLFPQR